MPETSDLRQRLIGWALDYAYVLARLAQGVAARTTTDDLLHPPPPGARAPILLIPGVYENWRFLQPVATHLYRAGHPVHVLDKLGLEHRSHPRDGSHRPRVPATA